MENGFHGVMDINLNSSVMVRVKLEVLHDLRRGELALAKQEHVYKQKETFQRFKMTTWTSDVFDALAKLDVERLPYCV